ncbi:MAG: hypothetical protein AB1324_02775 [Candidatus Micrarchaeota archaeon]
MSFEFLPKPTGIAAREKALPGPESEGPRGSRDLVLRAVAERCVARLRNTALSSAYSGPRCAPEALEHHSAGHDPEAETRAISLELLPLKFDITREAYGTGDPYVVMKSGGELSFFALHGMLRSGESTLGIATLAMRLPEELLHDLLREMKDDPAAINSVLHTVFPGARGFAFSITRRIDVIFDRSYLVIAPEGDKK